ncbi:aminotransferase class I/II-fold pyridoxal phosphate-dependent enzyme [Microbulbifer sp. 2205BS26-8]|uniref:aminotransferase class I/II-fold pyridoxal phosphate-dependent enzyme n=1 Tax=Microbulbifer sp. 2205BS26-8 TaxID=3064386 RepID=UPI00273D1D59|nr:aminotransferase class V-fold PLP-dependent enzyme [Microbulbifer sp. 2205BS26-8]MDP5210176.1 aminotransferase class V-fold PLP-dependent enzyme [Microbulbifer sp. 2205BS26-8]
MEEIMGLEMKMPAPGNLSDDALKLECYVALVSADSKLAGDWIRALNGTAARHDNPFGLVFKAVAPADIEVMARETDRLQAVIVDGGSDTLGLEAADALAERIHALRSQLNIFLVAHGGIAGAAPLAGEPADRVLASLHRRFDELFDRREGNFNHMFRLVQAFIARRASTPFADTLKEYVFSARDAWHTPGHSGGDSLRNSPWVGDFYRFMGEHVFNTDLSVSVQVLDSLLEPHSVIQEAQDLAAQAFGARHTFFLTNGTSTANKVVIQQILGGGGKIIVDQACHKSVHHAIVMNRCEPVYLKSVLHPEFGIYGPVKRADIEAALDKHSDARLLVITSCTYDGLRYDLKPIIDYAHQRGVKVLVDEAWFAHGFFHPELRPTALECGADYVTQSTHKMLSAFSQASMIHVQDPDFDEFRFRENLNMHASTSPQYAMIASLDVARKQMAMEGYGRLRQCLQMVETLRRAVNETGVFRALTLDDLIAEPLAGDNIRLDPTKVTIDISRSGYSGNEMQIKLFDQYGIQVEKTTYNTITVLVTLGSTESKLLRLIHAFKQLAGNTHRRRIHVGTPRRLPEFTRFTCLPADAYFAETEELPLMDNGTEVTQNLIGRTSADEIVPYPPGIPVLVPGQEISAQIVQFLQQLLQGQNTTEIHGLIFRSDEPMLRVVRAVSAGEDAKDKKSTAGKAGR